MWRGSFDPKWVGCAWGNHQTINARVVIAVQRLLWVMECQMCVLCCVQHVKAAQPGLNPNNLSQLEHRLPPPPPTLYLGSTARQPLALMTMFLHTFYKTLQRLSRHAFSPTRIPSHSDSQVTTACPMKVTLAMLMQRGWWMCRISYCYLSNDCLPSAKCKWIWVHFIVVCNSHG